MGLFIFIIVYQMHGVVHPDENEDDKKKSLPRQNAGNDTEYGGDESPEQKGLRGQTSSGSLRCV